MDAAATKAPLGKRLFRSLLRFWLVPVIVAGPWLPTLLFDRDPAPAPSDPCAFIAPQTLELLVPTPEVARSEADNTGLYTTHAYCEVETDLDRATTTARAHLSIEIQRHGSSGYDGTAGEARDGFVSSKQFDLDEGARVVDVPGLGDAAYATFDEPSTPEWRWVRLRVLAGGDEIEVRYMATPSRDDLILAAAARAARSVTEGLS